MIRAAAIVLILASTATAEEFSGKVVRVADGDTIEVLRDGMPARVRLQGIDSPELHQPFGSRAKQATSDLAFGKTVTVHEKGRDRYGRILGEVTLPDGTSLNHELVRRGFAWWYRHYSPKDTRLETLEAEARRDKRGLWVDANPIPPWDWRRSNRRQPAGAR